MADESGRHRVEHLLEREAAGGRNGDDGRLMIAGALPGQRLQRGSLEGDAPTMMGVLAADDLVDEAAIVDALAKVAAPRVSSASRTPSSDGHAGSRSRRPSGRGPKGMSHARRHDCCASVASHNAPTAHHSAGSDRRAPRGSDGGTRRRGCRSDARAASRRVSTTRSAIPNAT